MTVPRGVRDTTRRVSDMVREMLPRWRHRLTQNEQRLAIYLRGNTDLFEALSNLVRSRMEARAKLPEPADPLACKSAMARDRELQWLLGQLEFVYRSPVSQPAETEDSEPPAA